MYRIVDDLDIFHNLFFDALNVSNSKLIHQPTHDIIETSDGYVVEVYLPGVKKEDVSTEINNDELIITAERNALKDVKYIREQSFKGKYELKFKLSDNIDKENINALFEDGILKISISKQKQKKKLGAIKIEIK